MGEAENPGDGRGDFVGTVGDVDDGDRAGANEGVHGAHEGVAVGGVEALAGLVENEQAGPLDECARQQNHPLQACREGKEGTPGKGEELELCEAPAGG